MTMKTTGLGSRCIVFSFDDIEDASPTNVLAIIGTKHVFLCDTYLGPDVMALVRSEIRQKYSKNPWIIFNSHADWDHHWGNSFFRDSTIIGHELTRKAIDANGARELQMYSRYQRGSVEIMPPNEIFQGRIRFPNEGIEFFHSPGHTADSSSCYDSIDKVLFTGDNVEDPIPCLTESDLDTYVKTLDAYLELDIEHVVVGHGTIIATKGLIEENLAYLVSLQHGTTKMQDSPRWRANHEQNVKLL
nr:MBL fold metallo-hydrolase [Candidatus Sigynarchaeota archaeon]